MFGYRKRVRIATQYIAKMITGCSTLPSFIIVGAQKAGTVTLVNYLNQHPLLSSPNRELSYFNTELYHRGLAWYERQFPIKLRRTIYFEKTPEYIFNRITPKRICEFNKDIKLILLVRDPVSRAYSGWNHYKKYYYSEKGYNRYALISRLVKLYSEDSMAEMIQFLSEPMYREFENCIDEEITLIDKGIYRMEPSFVRRGLYYEQLVNYYSYFDRNQIAIFESKELKQKSIHVLNTITEFLEIQKFKFSDMDLAHTHKSTYTSSIESNIESKLRSFYKPFNEKFFSLIGKSYDWE